MQVDDNADRGIPIEAQTSSLAAGGERHHPTERHVFALRRSLIFTEWFFISTTRPRSAWAALRSENGLQIELPLC